MKTSLMYNERFATQKQITNYSDGIFFAGYVMWEFLLADIVIDNYNDIKLWYMHKPVLYYSFLIKCFYIFGIKSKLR